MGLTPKELRKLLVNNTDVVEQKMCAKDWDSIDFSKLPGRALSMYNGTFNTKEETKSRYMDYLKAVQESKVKMNVSNTVNAHEAFFKDDDFAQAAFVTMKESLAKSNKKILVISDTSGSMEGTPLEVSISLSILFGSLLTGDFHNCCIPFSSTPRFISWNDDDHISDIKKLVETEDVALNTNFQAVFDLILGTAISKSIPKNDMPEYLLVVSDMQFDQSFSADGEYYGERVSIDNIELIRRKYKDAGYDMPQMIYWNVAEKNYKNSPITKDDRGIMVSGFSQNIWKSIVETDNLESFNPYNFMMQTLMSERYDLL